MSTEAAYSIADLARLTGVSVRTIRYYLAQGLLPTSGESGPGAHYGDGHLHRLQLTRRLQEQHLPLAEIRRRLAELTDAEVATLVATPPEPAQATTSSALDYIKTVLGTEPAELATPPSPAMLKLAAVPPGTDRRGPSLLRRAAQPGIPRMRDEPAPTPGGDPAASGAVAEVPVAFLPSDLQGSPPEPRTATEPPGPERSQWDRLSLGPNVEIHVRRPLSRLEQRRVERLITIARQVLKEDTK
ncbi:MAG TPA: MerR family transcriptional regulator [Candidatus Limnocylindria bacterium]|nr:MerR family transcriptional regulator [Candidatus Limnocylindria bacterium]